MSNLYKHFKELGWEKYVHMSKSKKKVYSRRFEKQNVAILIKWYQSWFREDFPMTEKALLANSCSTHKEPVVKPIMALQKRNLSTESWKMHLKPKWLLGYPEYLHLY